MVSQQGIQESDVSWRRKKLCHYAYIPLNKVHLFHASQTTWTRALLVSGTSPSLHSAELPPSSFSPAKVLLPTCHALCVCPYCTLLPFGAFPQFIMTILGSPLLCWLPAREGCVVPMHRGPALLWDQREAQLIIFQLICRCAHPHWACLKTPAFVCRLTNRITAKLRTSSIYVSGVCVLVSFPHCLTFLCWLRFVY